MKTTIQTIVLASAITLLTLGQTFGAIHKTQNNLTGEIMYKEHFKLNGDISESEAFTMVKNWFTASPEKFSRGSKDQFRTTPTNMFNKVAVEDSFRNKRPLQASDTASKWFEGRGVVQYNGGDRSNIWLMYIEYYVIVEIRGNELTATISHIKYHHYNPSTYTPMAIANPQGSTFEASNGFENLVSAQGSNTDIDNVNQFLNNDISNLFNDLRMSLTQNNPLVASN